MNSIPERETEFDKNLSTHAKRMIFAGGLGFGVGLFSKEVAAIPVLWMLAELGYSYLLILRDGGVIGSLNSKRDRQ